MIGIPVIEFLYFRKIIIIMAKGAYAREFSDEYPEVKGHSVQIK
jgi:hypothetical protein